MPKKTKQWGWQCSECDKEPEMHPISYTPQIDIEAPRSSRNRGTSKANNVLGKFHLTFQEIKTVAYQNFVR